MILFIPYLLIFLYVGARLIWPLPFGLTPKLLLGALLFVGCFKQMLFNAFAGGPPFAPELPASFLMVLGWLHVCIIFMFFLSLARDVLILGAYLLRHPLGLSPLPGIMSIALLALIFGSYSVYEALRIPDVKPITIAIKDLPSELEGFKIVQLSDIHVSALVRRWRTEGIVEKTNRLNPDLILITGDFVDGYVTDRREDIAPLASLRAKYGLYSVVGNHEYYSIYQEWVNHLNSLGMNLLLNSHVEVGPDKAKLTLVGVTDPVAAGAMRGSLHVEGAAPDLQKALAGASTTNPTILLSHQPRPAKSYAREKIDLMLSGHTHGGMYKGFDRIVARFNDGYVSGLYQVGAMQLYVSNGSGLWGGVPSRLGVPGEITEITLTRAK